MSLLSAFKAMIKAVLTFVLYLKPLECLGKKMEPFVVEGNFSKIVDFPHSAYLECFCGRFKMSQCGGSILNQRIVLTAAHCMPDHSCTRVERIIASFGHVNKSAGIKITASKYQTHESYSDEHFDFDIALVLLDKPLVFSTRISRVAILNQPIRDGLIGIIAGWGFTNEVFKTKTNLLKHVVQKIITRNECQRLLGRLPLGVFCALDIKGISYPASGDSGSALVVNRYVQVGVVAYKMPNKPSIVVYTDIEYFYHWIRENALKLYCTPDIENQEPNNYDDDYTK